MTVPVVVTSSDSDEKPSPKSDIPSAWARRKLLIKWILLTAIPAIFIAVLNSTLFWYYPLEEDGGFGPRLLVKAQEAGSVSTYLSCTVVAVVLLAGWALDVFTFPGTKRSTPGGWTILLWFIIGIILPCCFYLTFTSYPYIPLFSTIFVIYPIFVSVIRRMMKLRVDDSWKNLNTLDLQIKASDFRFAGHIMSEGMRWREDKLCFYQGFAISSGIVGFVLLAVWALVVFGAAEAHWNSATTTKMSDAGINVETFAIETVEVVQFTLYLAPAITGISFVVFSFLGSLRATLQRDYAEADSFKELLNVHLALTKNQDSSENEDACEAMKSHVAIQKLSNQLHYGVCALVTVGIALYYGMQLSGKSSIASMFNVFAGMLLVFLIVMLFLNMRKLFTGYAEKLESIPVLKSAVELKHSDWVRGLIVLFATPVLPVYTVASFVNQRVRKLRNYEDVGKYDTEVEPVWFTKRFTRQLLRVKKWNFTQVLTKAYYWGLIVFFMTVGINLLLNMTLAAVREKIQTWNLGLVILMWFAIGLIAFALPPVPGPPVYLFGGAIIVAQMSSIISNQALAFVVGNAITILLSTLMKLMACAIQQKCIGEPLGTSLGIRRMVGVHQPFMRAVEMILKEPGIPKGKVAILCGGPDWPTSVLCGILRVPLKESLIGTLPIVVFVTPVVLYGSFASGNNEYYKPLSNLMFGVGLLLIITMGLVATSAVQDRYNRFHNELVIPREEFLQLDWETFKADRKKEVFVQVNEWRRLGIALQILFIFIVLSQCICSYLWMLPTGYCFEKFEVTDPTDKINGDLIKIPGIVGLSLFVASLVAYLAILKPLLRLRAKTKMLEVEEESEAMREEWEAQRQTQRITMEKEMEHRKFNSEDRMLSIKTVMEERLSQMSHKIRVEG